MTRVGGGGMRLNEEESLKNLFANHKEGGHSDRRRNNLIDSARFNFQLRGGRSNRIAIICLSLE